MATVQELEAAAREAETKAGCAWPVAAYKALAAAGPEAAAARRAVAEAEAAEEAARRAWQAVSDAREAQGNGK
jgi:hypothetical protein